MSLERPTIPEDNIIEGVNFEQTLSTEERAARINEALENNDLDEAKRIFDGTKKESGQYTDATEELEVVIAPLIKKRMAELLANKDGSNFIKLFNNFKFIEATTTDGFSPDDLQSPEIQQAIKEKLISMMMLSPKYFAEERDEWVKLGAGDAKTMNKWPEIQQWAKKILIEEMTQSPRYYIKARDEMVELGIIDIKDINKIPEIQELTVGHLQRIKLIQGTAAYEKERDYLDELGIIKGSKVDKMRIIKETKHNL